MYINNLHLFFKIPYLEIGAKAKIVYGQADCEKDFFYHYQKYLLGELSKKKKIVKLGTLSQPPGPPPLSKLGTLSLKIFFSSPKLTLTCRNATTFIVNTEKP